jgi:hypothetical protein
MPAPYTFRVAVIPAGDPTPQEIAANPSRHVYEVGQPGDPANDPALFTVVKIVDTQQEAAELAIYLNSGGSV